MRDITVQGYHALSGLRVYVDIDGEVSRLSVYEAETLRNALTRELEALTHPTQTEHPPTE